MAPVQDTASFFASGSSKQFEFVLQLYPEVLKLKAQHKCKKPDELIRLDEWYQNKLPQLIKKRGKDPYIVHEELVQTMKWKQTRGRFFPQLSYLIKVNTPRAVQAETKKAFRKLPNLEQAITALSNLKGVGTTMASALLAAAAPETAPFMADECLMAIPEIEGIDYTTREYMNFVQHIQSTTDRLNQECRLAAASSVSSDVATIAAAPSDVDNGNVDGNGDGEEAGVGVGDGSGGRSDSGGGDNGSESANDDSNNDGSTTPKEEESQEKKWSPHRVELALWTHYVASELQPGLLDEIPESDDTSKAAKNNFVRNSSPTVVTTTSAVTTTPAPATNGASLSVAANNAAEDEPSDESNGDADHGKGTVGSDDSSKDNKFTDSLDDCTKSEDSLEKPSTTTTTTTTTTNTNTSIRNNRTANDDVNDSDSQSSAKRSTPHEDAEEDDEEEQDEEEDEENSSGDGGTPVAKKRKCE